MKKKSGMWKEKINCRAILGMAMCPKMTQIIPKPFKASIHSMRLFGIVASVKFNETRYTGGH